MRYAPLRTRRKIQIIVKGKKQWLHFERKRARVGSERIALRESLPLAFNDKNADGRNEHTSDNVLADGYSLRYRPLKTRNREKGKKEEEEQNGSLPCLCNA